MSQDNNKPSTCTIPDCALPSSDPPVVEGGLGHWIRSAQSLMSHNRPTRYAASRGVNDHQGEHQHGSSAPPRGTPSDPGE